tara:strand:+ start:5063 stop:5389 length:327 start_codon:yes stop_codon:yes gene_type:complete
MSDAIKLTTEWNGSTGLCMVDGEVISHVAFEMFKDLQAQLKAKNAEVEALKGIFTDDNLSDIRHGLRLYSRKFNPQIYSEDIKRIYNLMERVSELMKAVQPKTDGEQV